MARFLLQLASQESPLRRWLFPCCYYRQVLQFNEVLPWLIRTQLPFPKILSRRLTNPKGKRKDRRKGKRKDRHKGKRKAKGNSNGKCKGKRKGKSIPVSLRRNLKSIQVLFQLNLNCRLTNPKGKRKGKCKDKSIEVLFRPNFNLPKWLSCRKHLSYSILRQATQAVAQAAAQQTAHQTAQAAAHKMAHTAHTTALRRLISYLICR